MTEEQTMNTPAKSGRKLYGKPFVKGQSGNPGGRPQGSRNKASLLIDQLMDGQAENIANFAIEHALQGDLTAVKLCLDRIAPPRKDRPIQFNMPRITTAAEASKAMGAILAAVAAGDITPDEAAGVTRIVETFVKTLEVSNLEQRVIAIEGRI